MNVKFRIAIARLAALLLISIAIPFTLHAKKSESTPENTFAVITLADGRQIEGYVVTPLQDHLRSFISKVGISQEFGGEAYEYTSDEIVSIVFPPSETDTTTVVYHSVWAQKGLRNVFDKSPAPHKSPVFLRLFYDGPKVKGYIMPISSTTYTGIINTIEYTWRYYYKCFDNDTAKAYWDDISGIIPSMKKVMKFYFHEFPLLQNAVDSKTIKAKDFRDNPAIVLPIMDLTYGDTISIKQ